MHLLGKEPIDQFGLNFVGLGGSPPGYFEDSISFNGHPYSTAEECDEAITTFLLPNMTNSQKVLITHFPPQSLGYITHKGNRVSAGNAKLEEIVSENSLQILIHIFGHSHIQSSSVSNLTKSVNPGSVLFKNYATVTLYYTNQWEVKEVNLKSL